MNVIFRRIDFAIQKDLVLMTEESKLIITMKEDKAYEVIETNNNNDRRIHHIEYLQTL
jgi:sensor histidine kinase YesM